MKFDLYYLFARIFPAILTAIPFVLFHHFYINNELSGFLHTVWSIHWIAELTMPVIFILFLVFVSRSISKMIIENKRYGAEMKMPTTNMLLLGSDFYSSDYKGKIHKKIFNDFGIKLLSHKEEQKNEKEARKRIVEAVSHIKERMKGGRLLSQHLMEYGFFRNFVGGSCVAVFFSIFCAVIFLFFYPSPMAFWLSIVGIVIYGSTVIMHGKILDWHGYLYARRLIQEYMEI